MHNIHVRVRQVDIEAGIPGSAVDDPVAHAVRRNMLSNDVVVVGRHNIFAMKRNGQYLEALVPDSVREFIDVFDETGRGNPINFDLEFRNV
jgi:hypothetical protein